jgi:hypothetical protein
MESSDGERSDWKPGWALAFCSGQHNPDVILRELREVLGEIPVVGGATYGAITSDHLGYTGYECAVGVFGVPLPAENLVTGRGLEEGERDTGVRLGEKMAQWGSEAPVLMFYDSVRSSGPPPDLHLASRLLDGVYDGLDGSDPFLIGAGTFTDQFRDGYVFAGQEVLRHSAVAVRMPGEWDTHTTITHGCIPVSSFREITRAEGPVVYELDGEPALDVLIDMLGSANEADIPLELTLGQKQGDPYAPDDESAFVNRLIIGTDPGERSVRLFEADFEEGSRVQIMSRDNREMLDSTRRRTNQLARELDGTEQAFALYIDCAGRTSSFCGAEEEEAGIVQRLLPERLPLLGFYSGTEIAPLRGRSQPLDYTGVLTIFTETPPYDGG